MKIRSKKVLSIVALCSSVSLFCVGFANWVITQGPVSVTGSISADNVKESTHYIKYNEEKPAQGFSFGPSGFMDSAADSPYTGTLTVTYSVNPNHVAEIFTRSAKLEFSLGLTGAATNNVLASEYITATAVSSDSRVEISSYYTNGWDGKAYKIGFAITYATNPDDVFIDITVTYTIDFTEGEDDASKLYKDYIFSNFGTLNSDSTSKLGFVFNAAIKK